MLKRYLLFRDIVSDETLSEEKITRLREVFLETLKAFLKEEKAINNVQFLPEDQQIAILTSTFMKLDALLYKMCKLGIAGAEARGVSSDEIKNFMKELEETSKKLRYNLTKGTYEAAFLISEFQLLERKIISSVADILSPNPLYEFSKSASKPTTIGRNVFIVHGRDDKSKLELARILEKLRFRPIILSEQPDKGRTIIEKLEEETIDVGYAFIILTPDDIGFNAEGFDFSKEKGIHMPEDIFKYRARQNVILELGYFIGKLGRNRVCCLYKGNVELPSDIHGILFKKFKDSVKECFKDIVDELKAAGYEIEM